jgi:hypothetical protein
MQIAINPGAKMNVELIEKTLNFIEENPEKWNQESYGDNNSPTNCFVGIAIRLAGESNPMNYIISTGEQVLDLPYSKLGQISYNYSIKTPTDLRRIVSQVTDHDFMKRTQ